MEKNEPHLNSHSNSFDNSNSDWQWRRIQQQSDAPSPRHLHSLVYYNIYDTLYLIGGLGDDEKCPNDGTGTWQYSLDKQQWEKIAPKNRGPIDRHSHQAVVFENKMILSGGISKGKIMKDLWSFKFVTASWKFERELDPVYGHSMAALGNKLVIFGGVDKNGNVTNNIVIIDASTFELLNDIKTDNAPPPMKYASMVSDGNSLWLFGGSSENSSPPNLYKMTIRNDRIITKSFELPPYMHNLQGASLSLLPDKSQLILFGGQTNQQPSDKMYLFHTGSSKWSACASVGPSARYHHQLCTTNKDIILFGGLGLNIENGKTMCLNDTWIFSDNTIDTRENVELDPLSIPLEIWHAILHYVAESDKKAGRNIASASLASKTLKNIVMTDDLLKKRLQDYIAHRKLVLPPIVDNRIKIAVVGPPKAGKSNTLCQYCNNAFFIEYDPIFEESFRKQLVVDGETYNLEVIDTMGTLEYIPLLQVCCQHSHGIYMVYSITSKQSFDRLGEYMSIIARLKGTEFPLIIVGNKCDLESERQVTQEQGRRYAQKYGAEWIETSAKTRHNIDESFNILVRSIAEADYNRTFSPFFKKQSRRKDRCLLKAH